LFVQTPNTPSWDVFNAARGIAEWGREINDRFAEAKFLVSLGIVSLPLAKAFPTSEVRRCHECLAKMQEAKFALLRPLTDG
jgi:hypothetical protein